MSEESGSGVDHQAQTQLPNGTVPPSEAVAAAAPPVGRPSEQTTAVDARETSLEDKIRRKLEDKDASESPTSSRVDPLIGRTINGRFQILAKIGAGGMGAVYRAKQVGMGRDVAIKVLLRELTENETVVRRFHIEALAVSKLKHPNTIQIFDFGETDDGLLYIAMEFLDGQPLQDALRSEGQLSVKRALHVATQMCRSLREAHGKGIVHRDLKPDNVFLCRVGEEADYAKVLDFGVAKVAEGDGNQKTLTKAGSIFGTPKYMSPEQSRGGDIDPRSDIYSIGVMLFEMLVGRVPFVAENPLGILIKHLQEHPPEFNEVRPEIVVPAEVQDFVFRLLEKEPDQRPQSTEAVIREIEKLSAFVPDIFDKVVTREDAEAAGIEINTSSRTALDTQLASGNTTVGALDDQTILGGQVAHKSVKRRKWPLIALALLLLSLLGAGGLYVALEPVPDDYREFTAIGDVELGTVPTVNVNEVVVAINTTPSGASLIDADGNVVGTTPHMIRDQKGAAERTFTVRLKDHHEQTVSVDFVSDKQIPVTLVSSLAPVVVKPTTIIREVTKYVEVPAVGAGAGATATATAGKTDAKAKADAKARAARAKAAADARAAREKADARAKAEARAKEKADKARREAIRAARKVDDTKKNPYGTSKKKTGGTKSSPY